MISGLFFRIVPPFSTRFIDSFFIYGDHTISALNVANFLGFADLMYIPKKYIHIEDNGTHRHSSYGGLYIKVADLPKVLAGLGWNPDDLKKMITPKDLARVTPRISGGPAPKKRVREETKPTDLSDDIIKLFAKRYVTENPEKVREVIVERLIGQNLDDFLKNL